MNVLLHWEGNRKQYAEVSSVHQFSDTALQDLAQRNLGTMHENNELRGSDVEQVR